MKLKNFCTTILCAPFIVTGFTSCSTSKSLATLKNEIAIKDHQQVQMVTQMQDLNKWGKEKLGQNELDETTGKQVQQILDSLTGNVATDVKNDSILLTKTNIKRKELKLMQKMVEQSETRDVLAINDVDLLTDLLNTTTFTRLNMAAFFEPGGYIVDANRMPEATKTFTPVMKDIQRFASKYKNRKLAVTIVSVGYADEQPISMKTYLYKKLSTDIGDTANPSRQQLNTELSRLRAFSISDVIKDINANRQAQQALNDSKVVYVAQGRGELLPSPTIKDYKSDDERRRIVVIYWGVLPQD